MTLKTYLPYVLFTLAAILFGFVVLGEIRSAHAETTSIPATVATTSNPTVTSTAALVFATSTCSSRTISTVASPIMITFTDAQGKVPTALFGMLQPASTTVAYDASQYGCGAVRIYSFTTSAITVSESR